MREEFIEFISSIYANFDIVDDQIILNGHDLVLNLVILDKWNEKSKNKKSMVELSKEWNSKGYFCIHIFEDDWNNPLKKDIIKSRIINKIGDSKIIYARKCEIREIDTTISSKFFNENHIQGNVGSKFKVGLYYKDELVSALSIGSFRVAMGQKKNLDSEGKFELLRFCNKKYHTVVGGASKLFSYFCNKFNPVEITTYSDKCWSVADLYKTLGFEYIHTSEPNYYYIDNGIRKHRFNFRKDRLIKMWNEDSSKTEVQMCHERGFYRIWDCGNDKLCYKNNSK